VVDFPAKSQRYAAFIEAYRASGRPLEYETASPEVISDDSSIARALTGGRYAAVLTRLAFENYLSLRMAELAHRLRSDTRLVLFTASTAPREVILRLFDGWVDWGCGDQFAYFELLLSVPPYRLADPEALEDALSSVLAKTPCFPTMVHYTSSTYERYRGSRSIALGPAQPGPAAEPPGVERLRELRGRMTQLSDELRALELLLSLDVPSSLNKIRFITEKVLHELCVRGGVGWGQGEPTLERMLGPLTSGGVIPRDVAVHVRTIQSNASPGSHYQESSLSRSHVLIAQTALVEFLEWVSRTT
jgi:hypothetical protein